MLDVCHGVGRLFHPLPKAFELGLEIGDQFGRGEVEAPGAVGAKIFVHIDRRRAALHAAHAGRAEEQVPAGNVIDGGLQQRRGVVFVAVKKVGADDGPVGEREDVFVGELHLIVGDERNDVHAEEAAHLVEAGEAAAGTEVGSGHELDVLDVVAALELVGHAL